MLKKGFRIIGKSNQIDANSEPLQQILNYSHSFSKVKAVLAAVLSFKHGSEAYTRAQEILFSMCTPSLKQVEGAKRLFKLEYGKDGEVYGNTRPCYQDGEYVSYKLRLLNAKSPVGKKLVQDSHIHIVTLLKQRAILMKKGIFLLHGNHGLKKLMAQCVTCRILRKQAIQAQLGPDGTMIQGRTVWEKVHMDLSGPFRIRLTRKVTSKVWVMGCTCSLTRFIQLQVIQNMKASSIMTGLQTCSANMGKNLPRLIYSDAAPNIHVLRSALPDDESEQMSHKEFQGLGLRLQREGAKIKRMVPYSQWTNGKMEKIFHLMNSTLKTWNVLNKGLPLLEFNFYISQAEIILNQRPLLLQELHHEQVVLTPNDLIYGHQLQEVAQSPSSHPLLSLYDNLIANTKVLRGLWVEAYLANMRNWSKWKFSDVTDLKEGDLLLIPDREGTSLGYGILTQKISDRTLELKVIYKMPQTDKNEKNSKTCP